MGAIRDTAAAVNGEKYADEAPPLDLGGGHTGSGYNLLSTVLCLKVSLGFF